jgi:polysaccharide biosynthesis protein PslG
MLAPRWGRQKNRPTGNLLLSSEGELCSVLIVLQTWSQVKAQVNSMNAVCKALVLWFLLVADIGAIEVGLPSVVVPDGLGVNYNYVGVGGGGPDVINIQQSGCKWVRTDIPWDVVEKTPGQYDFTNFDGYYNACNTLGMRILWNLDYSNPALYTTNPGSSTWRQHFADYAAAVADHFKGSSSIYELWNEPNSGFWPGGSNVSQYMALANKALPAMRQADPDCTIVAPATTGVDITFLKGCFDRGLLNYANAISVHPYRSGNNPAPESVLADYAAVRTLINEYKPDVPIVSSEWGWSTAPGFTNWDGISAQTQGDYLARMFLINASQDIPLSFWYSFKDRTTDPTDVDGNFGMMTLDLEQKPAFGAMRRLADSLAGMTFAERLPSDPNDWLLVFASASGNGHQALAAWTTGDAHTVDIGGRWGSLNLTSTPFYVPEPGSLTLLGMGLGGLVICTIRRRFRFSIRTKE